MIDHKKHPIEKLRKQQRVVFTILSLLLLIIGCGGETTVSRDISLPPPPKRLPPMRYTIQVGAFSNMNNAVRLTEILQNQGLDAYHFLHESGLYKVRFGNFSSKDAARRRAEELKSAGIIEVFYIVNPEDYAAIKDQQYGNTALREDIIRTAQRYIGVPYQWGGESARTGFDCSGLTMVVYQLNGLNLPRSSREQWRNGTPVGRSQLLKGDLVFFATSGVKRVSHVGIYLGNNKFLHAPGKGREIQVSSLSNKYYKNTYLGARTYL